MLLSGVPETQAEQTAASDGDKALSDLIRIARDISPLCVGEDSLDGVPVPLGSHDEKRDSGNDHGSSREEEA